jgi:hypothetical protein
MLRRPDFGSAVAREGLVGIVRQCLCASRKTGNCNERRRRRTEDGTTGSAPLRGGRYLLLEFSSANRLEEAISATAGLA